jgi:cysteine-rich repeat protein
MGLPVIRRAIIGLLAAAFASAAWGADIYVMSGGACPNHPSVLGASCTTAASSCGAAATPCCTIVEAAKRADAVGGSDRILVSQMTETVSATNGFCTEKGAPTTCTVASAAASYSCGGCAYVAPQSVVTIQPDGTDAYVLDMNNLMSEGITLFGNGSIIQRASGSFSIINKASSQEDRAFQGRNAAVRIWGDGVVVDGLTIQMSMDSVHVSAQVGLRCSSSGCVLRNNTITGIWNSCILVEFSAGFSTDCAAVGHAIYGNTCTVAYGGPSGDSSATAFMEEATGCTISHGVASGKVVLANNYFDYSGTTSPTSRRAMYLRENTLQNWIFNNRIRAGGNDNRGVFYLQDGAGERVLEDYLIFNNTYVSGGNNYAFSGAGLRNEYPTCFGSAVGDAKSVRIVNNLSTGFSPVAMLNAGCLVSYNEGPNTYHLRSTNDLFDWNYCYASSSPDCVAYTGGPVIEESNNIETTVNPNLTADLRLQAGSNAIAKCTNNPTVSVAVPAGQGAGVCSVTTAGVTFDCSKDFQGDQRPGGTTKWDCGADQFAGSFPICGNGITESGETCDDGNTTTETVCPYGTPTCALCRADCGAVLNLTGPYCGDATINGNEACDGANLNGHTCAEIGCSAGARGCTNCALTTGSCSSCGVVPAIVTGAKIIGGKVP